MTEFPAPPEALPLPLTPEQAPARFSAAQFAVKYTSDQGSNARRTGERRSSAQRLHGRPPIRSCGLYTSVSGTSG